MDIKDLLLFLVVLVICFLIARFMIINFIDFLAIKRDVEISERIENEKRTMRFTYTEDHMDIEKIINFLSNKGKNLREEHGYNKVPTDKVVTLLRMKLFIVELDGGQNEALGYLGKDQIVFIRNRKLIQRLALAVEPNLTKKNITDILYQLWV